MNIYVPLYRLILTDENRDNIKILIENCIRDSRYFNKFNEKIEYEFGKRTFEYVDDIYFKYINDINIGVFTLDILYKYAYENSDKINNNIYKWFVDFIDMDKVSNYSDYIYIHRSKYDRLKILNEEYESMVLKVNSKSKNELRKQKDKIKKLNEENKKINEKYNREKNKYEELKDKFYIVLGNMYFKNKKVLIICHSLEGISQEELNSIEELYGIKKIEIESSIKKNPKLKEKIKNSDIVILSVTQAKHDIDKLAALNENYYRTNRNNLDLIIKEVSTIIGSKIDRGIYD